MTHPLWWLAADHGGALAEVSRIFRSRSSCSTGGKVSMRPLRPVGFFVLAVLAVVFGGCTTVYPVVNAPGAPTTYQDPGTRGAVSGVGIESQDIISMTDQ